MSYTVLARRYRATTFSGVIGQESIAQTLQNAIAQDRVGHAYLFSGTRGVGKTSMARIFAAALNAPATIEDCPPPSKKDQDTYPDPEVQQRMAEAIRRGDDLNVIEIDGASNNSVDQARQLIANAGLSPNSGARYKVYIIDEVHMLSQAAFNALLKTMEEPPSHVKFILCTTEPHKVPPTVQSRCQRFDFRSITTAKIAEHVSTIIKQEKLDADDQVAWSVARLGNGSMRDALSLLDRMIAGADGGPDQSGDGRHALDVSMLEKMLGLPSDELVARLVDAFADGRAAVALEQVAQVLAGGISQDQLISVLIERFRHLMLIATCGADSNLVELSEEALVLAAEQSKRFDAPGLVHMIALCENLQRAAKSSANSRALLDATVVRLALAEKMADVTALLSRHPSGVTTGRAQAGAKKKLTAPPPPHSNPTRPPLPPTTPLPKKTPTPQQPVESSAPKEPQPAPIQPVALAAAAETGDDPGEIWSALLNTVSDKPAVSSWIGKLRLVRIDGRVAHVVSLPGQRGILGFVAGLRCTQLADLLGSVIRRPIEVKLSEGDPATHDETNSGGPEEHTAADASGGDTLNGSADRTPQSHPTTDRRPPLDEKSKQEAMELPLVRSAIQVLDATLIQVVRVEEPTTPS